MAICFLLLDLCMTHLLHPHAWIRLAASQLFSLYFGSFTPDDWVNKSTLCDGKILKLEINHNVSNL